MHSLCLLPTITMIPVCLSIYQYATRQHLQKWDWWKALLAKNNYIQALILLHTQAIFLKKSVFYFINSLNPAQSLLLCCQKQQLTMENDFQACSSIREGSWQDYPFSPMTFAISATWGHRTGVPIVFVETIHHQTARLKNLFKKLFFKNFLLYLLFPLTNLLSVWMHSTQSMKHLLFENLAYLQLQFMLAFSLQDFPNSLFVCDP